LQDRRDEHLLQPDGLPGHFLAGFALMLATAWCFIRAWTGKELWLRHAVASGAALTLRRSSTRTTLSRCSAWPDRAAAPASPSGSFRAAPSVIVVATATRPCRRRQLIVFRPFRDAGLDLQKDMAPEAGRLVISFGERFSRSSPCSASGR
jgi:hypothetical protein